jgi:hypothetical protein
VTKLTPAKIRILVRLHRQAAVDGEAMSGAERISARHLAALGLVAEQSGANQITRFTLTDTGVSAAAPYVTRPASRKGTVPCATPFFCS